jgi:hypothetical protein
MTATLIDVVNEVLRATGQRPNKTAFAETDSSAFLRDKINDALDELYDMAPFTIDADGTLTLPASTRTVAVAATLDPYEIYNWSWRINDVDGDIPLEFVSERFIIESFPLYETEEAVQPQYVYMSNNAPSFYPLLAAGSASLTIQYKYPTQFVKLTNTSAAFPWPDRSDELMFVKLFAQLEYEMHKLMGNPDFTREKLETKRCQITAKYAIKRPMGFVGNRIIGA